MGWKKCKCQLCDREAEFKELDTPQQKKYLCSFCGEYAMSFDLKVIRKKDEVSEYYPEIIEYLNEVRKGFEGCIEVVLHDKLLKKSYQISLESILKKLRESRECK